MQCVDEISNPPQIPLPLNPSLACRLNIYSIFFLPPPVIGLGERICPILSSTTTAVIEAMESDSTQLFSVNLPLTVPITLEQIQAPCSQGVMERCIYLYLTSNMADQLPQGIFQAFLAGNQTTISYGESLLVKLHSWQKEFLCL